MIDFQNSTFVKLSKVDPASVDADVRELYVEGETSMIAAKGIGDYIVFTNKRIIAVNIQGMTGKKRDTSSLPYSKIQAFSVETAGHFDRDSELELWFSGLGRVKPEFAGNFDVAYVAKLIGWAIL